MRTPGELTVKRFCPRCGMDKGDVVQGWMCGSIANWKNGSMQLQSAACAEIERLKGKIATVFFWLKGRSMCSKTQYVIGKNQMQELINILEAKDDTP